MVLWKYKILEDERLFGIFFVDEILSFSEDTLKNYQFILHWGHLVKLIEQCLCDQNEHILQPLNPTVNPFFRI